MNRTDALVAAIGAGVLVVALIGAALTGTSTAGGAGLSVTWAVVDATHELGDTSQAGSGEVSFEFDNPHANLTTLQFTVTVTAGAPHLAPQGDSILVTAVSPEGVEYTADGTLGVGPGSTTVELPVEVGAAPEVTTAPGGTPGAAEANLAATYTNTTGVGTWTITVAISHGSPSPEAHAVMTDVEVHWYQAAVAPSIPTTR
ncbi:MAG TPA: hypothetical protein VI997_04415 [Candidatus Thermoplasmatota archaeon]|nr:hypothetical protein [Candidatus Thermoplasmatota archaeon]